MPYLYVLTELSPVSTVYVEGLVALVDLPDGGVEDEAVGAQLGGRHAVHTLVELVALSLILVLPVLGWAFELGACGRRKWDIIFFFFNHFYFFLFCVINLIAPSCVVIFFSQAFVFQILPVLLSPIVKRVAGRHRSSDYFDTSMLRLPGLRLPRFILPRFMSARIVKKKLSFEIKRL